MALLGFQKWKADKVESGECRQTIRARRKNRIKVGDRLIFATGVRTKRYHAFGSAVCTETFEVRLAVTDNGKCAAWESDGLVDFEDIARRDGFADVTAMTTWFLTNHPVKSGWTLVLDVIRW